MTKEELLQQADRAEHVADQTVDPVVRKTLTDAAKDYRTEAKTEECKPDPAWKLPKEIS
jgi:hypothetical protein